MVRSLEPWRPTAPQLAIANQTWQIDLTRIRREHRRALGFAFGGYRPVKICVAQTLSQFSHTSWIGSLRFRELHGKIQCAIIFFV